MLVTILDGIALGIVFLTFLYTIRKWLFVKAKKQKICGGCNSSCSPLLKN